MFSSDDSAESQRFLFLLANFLREPPQDIEPFALFTIRADGAARLFQAMTDQNLEVPETLPLLPLAANVLSRHNPQAARRAGAARATAND